MKTKKEEKEIEKVDISDTGYNKRYVLSGNPLLKSNVSERLYENEKVNGTTIILLAALAANKNIKKATANIEEYKEGIKNLLRDNFNNPDWKRLEGAYKAGDNRSKSPVSKINPVLRALRREGDKGYIKGFNIARIGSEAIRKVFGFSF